jgi:hypothetical protein
VTAPATVTVATGAASATFTVTAAAVTTAQTAILTATLSGASITYPLQLNAAISALTLSATSLPFGSVLENATATDTVTLTSTGTIPLIISSGSVSGTGFSLSGITFPVTLNPTQTATLNVQFAPTSTGAMTGTLTITSNATSGATASILLSGTGTAPTYDVDLSWNAATGSDPVAGYNVYRATSGGTFTLMTSSPTPEPAWVDSTVQAGITYSYEVTSVDTSGVESVPSSAYLVSIP